VAAASLARLLENPGMRKIYEDTCKEGTREVYRTRIMLVGHFAAGKTSVKRSLLNEDFVEEHLTTDGVETEETVNVHTSVVDNKNVWQKGENVMETKMDVYWTRPYGVRLGPSRSLALSLSRSLALSLSRLAYSLSRLALSLSRSLALSLSRLARHHCLHMRSR
jgi:hypothetical protein